MTPEESIFEQALAMGSPQERAAFLDQACGGNVDLRGRVEVLLAAHERAGSFLESSPLAADATTDAATTAAAASAERAGATVGPYKLLEQIGEGGMGVVFMAEQQRPVRRRVALKIIKPGVDTKQVIARFEAERQALAMMDHPHIARVFEAGTTEAGRPYFVMELVKGLPVTEYCDQHKLSPRQRLELFVNVCQAVQHAHQKGIIHRDIKPTNVLVAVTDDGKPVPKVIDFGIAKATTGERLTDLTLFTEFRQLVGTPLYMSPEQAETGVLADVDTRSDVYSLGVLLYELLTGTTPFDKKRLAKAAYEEVRRIIQEEEPPRPSTRLSALGDAALTTVSASRHSDPRRLGQIVRGELDWIVMRALEKDRDRRYETANGFARDVERYLNNEPVQACPPSRVYRLRKFARRNKALLATVCLIAVVLVAATSVSSWQAVRATRAERLVGRERDQVVAEKQRADEQTVEAKRRLADSIVAESRMLLNDKRYGEAKDRLAQATDVYQNISHPPMPADLTLLDAYAIAPPPLNSFDTRPANRPFGWILPDRRTAIVRRYPMTQVPGVAESVDLRTGAVLQRFSHGHGILGVAVSGDGRLLLTGGATEPFDATLWDVAEARVIRTLKGHTGVTRWVALSSDGRRAATCSLDRSLRVWDTATGEPLHVHKMDKPPMGMVMSSDGTFVALPEGQQKVDVYEADTGKLRQTIPVPNFSQAFSRHGHVLALARHGAVLWDVQQGRAVRELEGEESDRMWTLGVAFIAGDREMLVGQSDSRVVHRDAQTGAVRRVLTSGPQDTFQISASDDGLFATTGSSPGDITHWGLQRSMDVIDVQDGGSPAGYGANMVITPDGLSAICAGGAGKLRMWDLATGQLLHEFTEDDESRATAVTPDGKLLLGGSSKGELRLWELDTAKLVRTWTAHGSGISAVAISPDGMRAVSAGASDGDKSQPDAKVWELSTARQLGIYEGHRKERSDTADGIAIRAAAFTRDGGQVMTAGRRRSPTVGPAERRKRSHGGGPHGLPE